MLTVLAFRKGQFTQVGSKDFRNEDAVLIIESSEETNNLFVKKDLDHRVIEKINKEMKNIVNYGFLRRGDGMRVGISYEINDHYVDSINDEIKKENRFKQLLSYP